MCSGLRFGAFALQGIRMARSWGQKFFGGLVRKSAVKTLCLLSLPSALMPVLLHQNWNLLPTS